jgi:hypothetical protein
MFAKSCAVELIASKTSGNISEPDRKVIVTPALIIGVTPNSLKRSLLTGGVPALVVVGVMVPITPPEIDSRPIFFITSLLFMINI